jgi:hypothetical protein
VHKGVPRRRFLARQPPVKLRWKLLREFYMGRFALAAIAMLVCARVALADSVARESLPRDLLLRSDKATAFALSVASVTVLTPVRSGTGLQAETEVGAEFSAEESSLVRTVVGDLEQGLFEGDGALISSTSENYFGSAVVSSDSNGVHRFDWPDFSGIVELLVSESTHNLMSKYRMPGQHGPNKKKKKTKEEHMADGKCRSDRGPRNLFFQSFHVLAATLIGIFLVVVVLRRSGKGSYWW